MTKELWINLPVKDLKKSREFFSRLGFTFRDEHNPASDMAGMAVGKHNVMLFAETTLQQFMHHPVADTTKGTEVLISISADSREEVDDLARKVEEAGGTLFGRPEEIQGWMYGCGFIDLDGHRWNSLYMDMSKMPKQGA